MRKIGRHPNAAGSVFSQHLVKQENKINNSSSEDQNDGCTKATLQKSIMILIL
jgi:hypothetical protein